jgi:hypothetical protein
MVNSSDTILRKSLSYNPSFLTEKDPRIKSSKFEVRNSDIHMLREDLQNHIAPYSLRRSENRLEIKSDHPEAENILIQALKFGQYQSSAEEGVIEFLRKTVEYVLHFEKAIYEIAFIQDESSNLTGFSFLVIHPLTVRKQGNDFIQFVPSSIQQDESLPEEIHLDKELLLVYTLPKDIHKAVQKSYSNLLRVPSYNLPEFFLEAMAERRNVYYDGQQRLDAHELATYKGTKELGWNARKGSDKYLFDFYWFYRNMIFARMAADIRASLLEALNLALLKATEKINIPPISVSLKGFPAPEDFDTAMSDFIAGNLSYEQLGQKYLR